MLSKAKSAASKAADKVKSTVNPDESFAASQGKAAAEEFTGQSISPGDRGQVNASRAVNLVVALMVGGLVAAFLLPVAIEEIVGIDTSSWGSGASSLWNIMDLILVLAAFLFFIQVAVRQSD